MKYSETHTEKLIDNQQPPRQKSHTIQTEVLLTEHGTNNQEMVLVM